MFIANKCAAISRHEQFLDAEFESHTGDKLSISLSLATQHELLRQMLSRVPGSTNTTQLALTLEGVSIATSATGQVLLGLHLPGSLVVQVLIPPQGIEPFQRKIAELHLPTKH